MNKIILLGYMGSGKSAVAELLAANLQLPWLDLDRIIEESEQASISEIFKNQGEIKFRKLEHETFGALLKNETGFVLSLGGGTPCYANNHKLLQSEGVVSFYLKASIDTLFARLHPEKSLRPLLAGLELAEMKEFIAISLFERSYFYHHAAHTIVVDGKSLPEIAAEINAYLV